MALKWGASENNIGLMRFVLASIVVVAHVRDLSQRSELDTVMTVFSANLAVQCFFVISGYLVLASYDRSSSIRSYLAKRVRRVYPAYFTVVFGFAVGLSLLSRLSLSEYFSWPFLSYLIPNLAFANFIQPEVADVFAENPKNAAVNGALWTLKLEVVFYLLVPVIAIVGRKVGRNWTVGILFISSVLFTMVVESFGGGREITKQLPGQLAYFCVGMAFYQNQDRLNFSPLAAFVAGMLLFLASSYVLDIALRPIAVGAIVMAAAHGPYLGHFERYGDFSFGLYILHFPIIQILVSETHLPDQPFLLLGVSYGIALIGAVMLWNIVERRFLRRNNHYRSAGDVTEKVDKTLAISPQT